jgi:hypothetical protein
MFSFQGVVHFLQSSILMATTKRKYSLSSVYLPRPSVPEYVPEGVRTPQIGSFSTEE